MKNLIEILKHKKGKLILPFFLCGLIGMNVEVLMTALGGNLIGFKGMSYMSLVGHTSIWMILVYGIGFTFINILNEFEKYYKLPMITQTLYGGLFIGMLEFISGYILNIRLGLAIWDYQSLTIMGQVCLQNYILFTISIPLAIWIFDIIGWAIYREEWKYGILDNYKQILREINLMK